MKFNVKIYHKKFGFEIIHADAPTNDECWRMVIQELRQRPGVWHIMEINEAEEQKEVAK